MQTRILTGLAILSFSLVLAQAQSTVNFAAGIGQPNVYWSGAPVPDGNEVRIGFFNGGFDISSHLYDLNALDAAWNLYGATNTTTLMGVQPGSFAGSQSLSEGSALNLFDGQKIYVWIFKTGNNGAPATDYGNVSGYGLFSSTSSDWLFPSSTDPFNSTASINSSQINQSLFGSYDANHLYLTGVPEPSIAGLIVLGMGLTMLNFRRKRN